ncbi:TraB/GumN family protein [Candidatus Woesearchaeota archaeon]|nr:TraB/GumN family protein [Candidatus Woesearchaeota archaeon]
MQYKNLTIIGTSHISRDSIQEVKDSFGRLKPGIVAVELDRKRLYALVHNLEPRARFSDIRRIGLKGFLFVLVGGWLQRKLGQYVGVAPGSEMKAALQLASECNAKVALIDRDIEITMQRFSRCFTWREKLNLIRDLFAAPFSKKEKIDLSKVPEKKLVKKLLGEVKRKYPSMYRVLIEERNEVMASNIIRIMQENPESSILAIVGAGHEDEILQLVSQKE